VEKEGGWKHEMMNDDGSLDTTSPTIGCWFIGDQLEIYEALRKQMVERISIMENHSNALQLRLDLETKVPIGGGGGGRRECRVVKGDGDGDENGSGGGGSGSRSGSSSSSSSSSSRG